MKNIKIQMISWKARWETREGHKNGQHLARTSLQISKYHTLGGCELLCPKVTHFSIEQTSILWKHVTKNTVELFLKNMRYTIEETMAKVCAAFP
jgi:hypothetical protein